MEREAILVGIDVGTSKVCALIGEVRRDGGLTIIGKGTMPATGLKKGVVVNIDQTVHSIAQAVEQAERLSGMKIDRAFVAVGGQHVESQNSPGTVAVSAPRSGKPSGKRSGAMSRGARPLPLNAVTPRACVSKTRAKRSPPMEVRLGRTTAQTAAAVTAASTALPPSRSAARPAVVAR